MFRPMLHANDSREATAPHLHSVRLEAAVKFLNDRPSVHCLRSLETAVASLDLTRFRLSLGTAVRHDEEPSRLA